VQAPTPQRLYNAACTLAILSQKQPDRNYAPRAIAYLQRALDAGQPAATIADDPDLDGLRKLPEFTRLVNRHKATQVPSN
jgi:hypothetical protein